MEANIKEVLSAIMDLIDKDHWIPDCGSDFQGEDCRPCKYFYQCDQGIHDEKQAKMCRELIENIK